MALLNDRRVTDLDVMIPPAGGWLADVTLDSGEAPPAGAATLTVGDLALVGRILPSRGGQDAPARPRVVVAGGYGWRTLLPAPGGAYTSPTNVRLSDVLADLGRLTGEAYDAPAEVLLGPSYGWDAPTTADAVLADLITRGALPTWRVQANGRTSFTAWPTLPAADAFGRIVDRNLERGVRTVALDVSASAFLPGATLEGKRIDRVSYHEHGGELRARVYEATAPTPAQSIKRMVLKLFPFLARFRIDATTGDLVIKAANSKIDLVGGGPAAARKGDTTDGGGLAFYPGVPGTTPPSLWYTASRVAPYTWAQVSTCLITGPLTTDAGTRVAGVITSGSGKVTIG